MASCCNTKKKKNIKLAGGRRWFGKITCSKVYRVDFRLHWYIKCFFFVVRWYRTISTFQRANTIEKCKLYILWPLLANLIYPLPRSAFLFWGLVFILSVCVYIYMLVSAILYTEGEPYTSIRIKMFYYLWWAEGVRRMLFSFFTPPPTPIQCFLSDIFFL